LLRLNTDSSGIAARGVLRLSRLSRSAVGQKRWGERLQGWPVRTMFNDRYRLEHGGDIEVHDISDKDALTASYLIDAGHTPSRAGLL
jgi:hypothetical protein